VRGCPRGRRLALALPLLLGWLGGALPGASARLPAETQSSVTVTVMGTLSQAGGSAALLPLVNGCLQLESAGSGSVKGFLELDSWVGEGLLVDVPRAYAKVKLPWFRLTLGKTRLSWGQGFVFNAGDVIFGSMGLPQGQLFAPSLRPETSWLAALYLPLGSFSFLEAVLLPYVPLPPGSLPAGTPDGLAGSLAELLKPVGPGELSGGLRGSWKLGATTVEAGYLYAGRTGEHRPYASLHGHLLVDWSLSGALAVPEAGAAWGSWRDWLSLSAGVFHLLRLGGDRSLSLRLEAALRPGGSWKEVEGPGALPAGVAGAPGYGLYLFPELVAALSDTLSLELRALVSPVDGSALGAAGASWKVYQGLTLLSYLALMTGDENDLFGWNRDGAVSWTVGAEYVF
jgi:hypothetical protein